MTRCLRRDARICVDCHELRSTKTLIACPRECELCYDGVSEDAPFVAYFCRACVRSGNTCYVVQKKLEAALDAI